MGFEHKRLLHFHNNMQKGSVLTKCTMRKLILKIKLFFFFFNVLIHELVILASSIIPSLLKTKALAHHDTEANSCQLVKALARCWSPETSNTSDHYSLQSPHLEFTTNWAESHYFYLQYKVFLRLRAESCNGWMHHLFQVHLALLWNFHR